VGKSHWQQGNNQPLFLIKAIVLKSNFLAAIFLILLLACNTSSVKKIPKDDSLQYYPPTPDKLDDTEFRNYYRSFRNFFDTTLLKGEFNGAILIAKEGNIIYEKYQGRVDLRKPDSINVSTPFHLASTSKTFTAIAVLRLVQEGRIKLADTINRFFPGLPYSGITLQMLLNHRSGLPNYLYFMSNNKWGILPDGKWNKKMATNGDMLQMLTEKKPDPTGKPGTRFNYSNTNYALLALVIEKITGKSYPDYMKENIFTPLQMTNTFVFSNADSLAVTPSFNMAGTYWNPDFLDATYGDKNIYSTPRDLLKWDQALYTNQLLNQALLDSAFKPYSFEKPGIENYGLGWRLQLLPNGKKIIYHFGKWHGNNAAFVRLTDEKATIIILGNRFTKTIYSAAYGCYHFFGDYTPDNLNVEEEESPETAKKLIKNGANQEKNARQKAAQKKKN
jgi:CubicO group peptidase (beta-lactamase class C family)